MFGSVFQRRQPANPSKRPRGLGRKAAQVAAAVTLGVLGMGCESLTQPQVGLNDTATHTGTMTILRVDHGWQATGKPEFLPLRDKGNYSGLNTSEAIITPDDTVTVTLNSAFLKYFKEAGGEDRKGEIAVVLAFDAGTQNAKTNDDAIILFSSQGQTLGSYLSLTDWPVLGPMKIDADQLRLRVVVIELDQVENAQTIQLIKTIAATATTLVPGIGGYAQIGLPVVEALINLNGDDVILDQRFALQRAHANPFRIQNPLLAGTYALVLQEDPLANAETSSIAYQATLPVQLNDMRFHPGSGRLYRVQNYLPQAQDPCNTAPPADLAAYKASPPSDFVFESGGIVVKQSYGLGPISFGQQFISLDATPGPALSQTYWDERGCLLNRWVNGTVAKQRRESVLGYANPGLGDLQVFGDFDAAMRQIVLDAARYDAAETDEKVGARIQGAYGSAAVPFNYRTVLYPEAYTILTEYPFHTNLVFTISNSATGVGKPVQDDFQTYVTFLQGQIDRARSAAELGDLNPALQNAVQARRGMESTFARVSEIGDTADPNKDQRACLLHDQLLASAAINVPLADAEIYNRLFHLTGKTFRDASEVKAAYSCP